ncbi:hypothetical protein Hte_008498 [Hypoxylon texense]
MSTRKEPREYSSNPSTMRVRARKARLSDHQRELEQSKAADSKAVTRAWKIRASEDTFKMASPEDQKTILDKVEKEVMERRRHRGIDSASKISNFVRRKNSRATDSPSADSPSADSPPADSPSAVLVSPTATGPVAGAPAEVPMGITHEAVSFGPLRLPNRQGPYAYFPHHNEADGQQFGSGQSPLPSFYTDQTNGDNGAPPLPRMLPGYGAFDPLPIPSDVQADLAASRNQIAQLKGQVDALTHNLDMARAMVADLEARIEKMDHRMSW